MRLTLLASLLAATASIAADAAEPAKPPLLTPPEGARHYTISSIAGKHGDS